MRRFDEVARFWNDARARMPPTAWSWPIVAATVGVLVTAVTSSSWVSVAASPNATTTPAASHGACQGQTWPYLSDACLRRDQAATARPAFRSAAPTTPDNPRAGKQVRVLNYQPDMAAAAIGATPWAPKETVSSHRPQPPQKRGAKRQASHDLNDTRTVTVRSGRGSRNTRERVYVVPGDSAYRAYGYVPR